MAQIYEKVIRGLITNKPEHGVGLHHKSYPKITIRTSDIADWMDRTLGTINNNRTLLTKIMKVIEELLSRKDERSLTDEEERDLTLLELLTKGEDLSESAEVWKEKMAATISNPDVKAMCNKYIQS